MGTRCAGGGGDRAPALTLDAQVGKSQGVVDANTASEKDLAGMPHMPPAIAKALVGVRPFKSITELNTFLVGQGLTQEQAMDFYQKAFVHVNLNTATPDEILLIPGAGKRMVREFAEYRPWKTWAQFDKEIGKYVGADATAKLAQYVLHPGEPQHGDRRGHPQHSRSAGRAWCGSSRNTVRGSPGRSSTRKSASTSRNKRWTGSSGMW